MLWFILKPQALNAIAWSQCCSSMYTSVWGLKRYIKDNGKECRIRPGHIFPERSSY